MALRNLTTQVNEGSLQISQEKMFMEVFGPVRHGQVRGYRAGVTPTKLWGSSSSRMYDLEQWLQESEQKCVESEHKRVEVDAELKEEVKNLKSMLEQLAIQMAEQRRNFEEQQASQMEKQIAHYDNMWCKCWVVSPRNQPNLVVITKVWRSTQASHCFSTIG